MNSYQPKKILLTGGAGFIGANFVRHLLANEASVEVVNLDSLTYAGSLDNLNDLPHAPRYSFVQGDITDRALIDTLLRQHQIDTIVHFAAESHVDRSIANPDVFIQTNLVGTFNLLDAARQYWLIEKKLSSEHCRFHHISTDEVYGSLSLEEDPSVEGSAYIPNSPYSASKAGADHLVRAYAQTFGLPVTTTLCSNNYGPYQHKEKFIPTVITACLQWMRIPVYGEGSNIRDWIYVEDHCRGILSVIKKGRVGESYHLSGNNEWENIAVVKYICHVMDELRPKEMPYKNLITFVTDRAGHDKRYALDATKVKNELGWEPEETFSTGIMKTIEFYLDK